MTLEGRFSMDCSRTQEALKGTGIECPKVTVAFIERMIGWYENFLRNG
jgi:hypothetical protein